MFPVARRIASRPGRGGWKGNALAALRLPRLEDCPGEGAASAKNPLQPVLGGLIPLTSARRTRRRCWLEHLTLCSKEMVMEKPSPLLVGREFVRQYYTLLNKAPEYLHR